MVKSAFCGRTSTNEYTGSMLSSKSAMIDVFASIVAVLEINFYVFLYFLSQLSMKYLASLR